jgi:hypothetical protein
MDAHTKLLLASTRAKGRQGLERKLSWTWKSLAGVLSTRVMLHVEEAGCAWAAGDESNLGDALLVMAR